MPTTYLRKDSNRNGADSLAKKHTELHVHVVEIDDEPNNGKNTTQVHTAQALPQPKRKISLSLSKQSTHRSYQCASHNATSTKVVQQSAQVNCEKEAIRAPTLTQFLAIGVSKAKQKAEQSTDNTASHKNKPFNTEKIQVQI